MATVYTFTRVMWAELLTKIKKSGVYKTLGMTWEECIGKFTPFSVDTADRMIADWQEFGRAWFEVKEIVNITREAFRQAHPEIAKTGELIIGGERYAKGDTVAIQAAFEQQRAKVEKLESRLADAERAKKDLATERDNAKKAVEKTRKEFAEFRYEVDHRAEIAWEHADEDQRFLIKLEMDRDFLLQRLRSFADCRELSAANQDRLVAFCEATWAEVHQVCEKIRGNYGVGLLSPNPASSVEVDELTPNKRSLIQEYEKKHPLK